MTPLDAVSIVVPTVGRPSVVRLLRALARQAAAAGRPGEILIVDDRSGGGAALPVPRELAGVARVVAGRGAGPAAARNAGWRAARGRWISFLDDDVVPAAGWLPQLRGDLAVDDRVGGVQGRVHVPLPAHRRPTDWERNTGGLAGARWITADMAYRREALAAVGGFDERFTRAYREDAELAHRVSAAGWRLQVGRRRVLHPVRPEGIWVSLRSQRGNADDALLRRLYGHRWRRLLDIPGGRRPVHLFTTATAGAAVASAAWSASRPAGDSAGRLARRVAAVACVGWLAATGQFALARIRDGPLDPRECGAMVVTSVLIPPLAAVHWLRGWCAARDYRPWLNDVS